VTTGRRLLAVVACLTAVLAGCGAHHATLVLDGRPRYPDDEGVATTITLHEIVLDGRRHYRVAPGFVSFSTYTLALEPMVDRVGQYVQLGLDGHSASWMAGIGSVLRTTPPTVVYTGVLLRVDRRRRAIFRDGTVIHLALGVVAPPRGILARAQIDPARHWATALVAL
jgi:hypothetical protein